MAYLGVSPSNGVRQKHTYTATASQTSFSGAGAENITLSYKDSNYVDVYQNGVKLSEADYTATTGTTIVLATGATVSDMIEVVVYDVFSVADTVSKADGGTFDNEITLSTHLNMPDNAIIKLGADADLQISHNGSNSIIRDNGTGALDLQVSNFAIVNLASDEFLAKGTADGAFELYHNGAKQLETTASGVTANADLAVGDDIGLTSDSAQITFGADSEVILAHTADTGLTLQGSGLNTNFSLLAFHTTDSTTPDLRLGKSSNSTVGTFAETADGEALGQIRFTGQDSNNAAREGMTIAVTQDGSSTSSTVPAKITFTNSGGERLRIMANGRLENQSPSNTGNVLQDFRIDFRNENNAGIMAGIGCVRTDNANAPGAFVIRTSTNVDSSSNSGDGEISEKFRVAANGDLTATDTSIASNSDSRLKENISDFSYDLDKFKSLKTKTFDWKNP